MLQILTIHEAYPGHYVQLDYSNRVRSPIRKILSSGVFAEGWAVYTEQMMLDQGYGNGDLALRLHQLKFYLRAVLNAILDHSMHCTEMTDEQAMELLVGRGYQTEPSRAPANSRPTSSVVPLFTGSGKVFSEPGPISSICRNSTSKSSIAGQSL
jgi:spore cortex formation protein SpoVR/YcgB (stage V sporulation)